MRYVMFSALIAAGAAVAIPSSAAAASETPSSEQGEAQSREDYLNEVVCRRDAQIGSRVQRRRTCMTRREQIRMQNETRQGVGEFVNRATSTPITPD